MNHYLTIILLFCSKNFTNFYKLPCNKVEIVHLWINWISERFRIFLTLKLHFDDVKTTNIYNKINKARNVSSTYVIH